MTSYLDFLSAKAPVAESSGLDVDPADVNPILKPHQRAIVVWAVRGGRRAIFAAFGLGKSVMQIEILRLVLAHTGGRALIVCPLGVRQEFVRDARMLGQSVTFVRRSEQVDGLGIYLTNYESVRDGKLDPNLFDAVSLDEASILRSFGSKTYQTFLPLFDRVKYRFVATATPSPNRYKELIHYAGFLGVMDTGNALTRFFQRDSTKANNLTLYPHKEREFWLWLNTWAVFLQKPSDLGYPDDGYDLPELEVVYHEVAVDHSQATVDRDGQAHLFRGGALGVTDAAREKRDTLDSRIDQLMEILRGYRRGAEVVPAGVLPGEPGTVAGRPAGAEPGKLSAEPRGVQGQVSAVAGAEPGAVPGADSAAQRGEPGADPTAQPGVVSGEPGTGGGHDPAGEAASVRPDAGAVRGDAGGAAGSLSDLPGDDGPAGGRSLPRRRRGSRTAVPAVQLGDRSAAGRSGAVGEGDRVSDQVIIWCDLNAEQGAIEAALRAEGLTYSSIHGGNSLEENERRIDEWRNRRTYALIGKPVMLGQGMNLQQCNKAVFLGVTFKFNDLIQAIHRTHRFGQTRTCRVHIIHAESEREVVRTLRTKWAQHKELTAKMTEVIREHGLDQSSLTAEMGRSMGIDRVEASGDGWLVANNDCVVETESMDTDSVDLIVTSIPFSNHYEYTPSYNDFGHTDDNDHFWSQMDFLTPQLLRVLRPGRIYACHVKDRILFGNVTGAGVPTVSPFHAEAIFHGRRHGFDYLGMITVVTDVVRENNQTYRLGWSEQCKDGTKMGVGSPEYILLFRKPQSDRTRSYADVPVVKDKAEYSRARWQVDAHAFWRSSGDRHLTPEELAALPPDQLSRLFTEQTLREVYDYERHVQVGEALDRAGSLPATFMSLAPGSHHPEVWHDVNRMLTLNSEQSRRAQQMHVCLARDSLVLTRGGYKPIQQVQVGELVLTHKGRWRPVLAVQNTGVRPVVNLRAQGVPGLVLTPDHKVWARKSTWTRAHAGTERAEPGWVPASESVGGYVNLKLPPVEAPSVADPHYWWIVGRWLADGHIDQRGSAVISYGRHEAEALLPALGEFGGNLPRDTGTGMQIALRDPGHELRRTLKACGTGAAGKHLPPEAYTLPVDQARALLDGYLSGDGHYLPARNRWMASSVSKELLLGIAMLAQRVHGAIASVYPGRGERTGVIQGRSVSMAADWILCFDIPDPNRRKGPLLLDDGAWKKVRSAEPAGEVETWNLRVEEDESYTAEGCVVKNCPLQFDIVDRLINRYSNPGELVFDPFGGLFTVPVRALRLGRRGRAVELNAGYFADGVRYLRAEEARASMPTLFDLDAVTGDGGQLAAAS